MRAILIWLERWIRQRLGDEPLPQTRVGVMSASEGGIDDGVDYSIPAILPGWLRRAMEANVRLRESVISNLNDRSTFGSLYRSADAPLTPVTEDPLLEWDAATRERILSNCHAAYQRNPLAHAAVNYTTDFVIGDGFNLVCKHPEVERILKAFIDNPDNALRKYERQAVNDLQVDGELIVRFYSEGGETVVVPQRPWELKWIQTEAGFFRRPEIFHFERVQTEGDSPTGHTETAPEHVPADAIHFVTINDHAYELRGRPELYRVLPWLRADKEWLEERTRQNKWRNALLWHVKVENATSAMIANVAQRWRRPPSPGSAYVSSAAEDVKPLVNPISGGDAGHDGRAIRLMVILGMRLPEYFFADGANSNLATSTRQELPALTKFEAFQQIMIEQVWTPIFRRVLQNALDAGILPEMTSALDAFEVSYEPVTAQDLNALANMLDMAVKNKWTSAQTAAEKLGFDPSVERERMGGNL